MTASSLSRAIDDNPPGKRLAELIVAPLEAAPFLKLASRIALALSELHRRGILHKDINPRTLVLDEATGAVAITDFRFASYLPREQQSAQSPRGIEGTLEYIAPEQTGRMNRRIDQRSDLYSLGVTFYELLTGRLPFSASDALGWVHAHVALTPTPAAELVPAIPAPVSAIVMRLLAKAAEDRYESALGLKFDLDRCLESLEQTGQLAPFPLGEQDGTERLSVPQKLYGRDAELRALSDAIGRIVTTGRPAFIVVSGPAGVGKSTLIQELYQPLLRARGLFISGKCEQYNRGIPYSTLVLAFRELTQQLLTESDRELAAFRTALKGALGDSGGLIVEVLPEVKLILGEQPPLAELGPAEAQNRFKLVFQRFIRAVARPDHPLVLFLDDLQWADAATLDLLTVLAADPELQHIGFVLAYRDNEVDAAHPLHPALLKLERGSAGLQQIALAPLSLPSITALVADTLRTTPGRARSLAHLVQRKTLGNPFFAGEFLKALFQEGLIARDPAARGLRWDMDRIEVHPITANVVDLLLERLKRLPAPTQRALTLAACVGTTFRLTHLAALSGEPISEVARDLFPAMKDELITSVGAAYPRVIPRDPEAALAVYRFEHDRIQQAAYSLLDDDQRRALHLAVGRMLLATTPADERDGLLFEIVNHLNIGLPQITEPAERRSLLELNAAAGRKARASAAYAPALRYFRAAKHLFLDAAWEASSAEALSLHCDLAACEYLNGHHAAADALLDLALAKTTSPVDHGQIYVLRLKLYESSGRIAEGITRGIEGLRELGIEIPSSPEEAAAATTTLRAEIKEMLRSRRPDELLDAPQMPEGVPKTAMTLLVHLTTFAFIARPQLYAFVNLKSVALAIEHGNAPYCAKAYLSYSVLEGLFFDDLDTAHTFSTLALRMCERFDDVQSKPTVLLAIGMMLSLWSEPYSVSLEHADRAYRAAIDAGNFAVANYAGQEILLLRFLRGDDLSSLADATTKYKAFARQTGNLLLDQQQDLLQLFLQELRGQTEGRGALLDAALGEEGVAARLIQSGQLVRVALYSLLGMLLASVYDRHREALAYSEAIKPPLSAHKGRSSEVLYFFHRGLSLAALYPAAAPDDQHRYREELLSICATVERWASRCPQNFAHQHLLLLAELARIDGQPMEAARRYEDAARVATRGGFVQHAALANELAAKCFLHLGIERSARAHLEDACAGYRAWGAHSKVRALREAYPGLIPPAEKPSPIAAGDGATIDLLAVFEASQALSSEIDRDLLLHRLMTLTLQSAAAERGCLLRVQGEKGEKGGKGGNWFVLAEACVDKGEIKVTLRDPSAAKQAPGAPASILRYVTRTRTSVVLDDASRDSRFAGDPQITSSHPRSALCLPLLRQGELIGILYLENNLTPSAFTKDRTAVLELLASQAAISLENATLYTELRQENTERKRAEGEVRKLNGELEQRVTARTAELELANRELETFSYSVSHDLQTPIRSIDGFSLALLEDYGPALDATGRGYITEVRAASRRMAELIEDLLNLARITRAELASEELDLSAVARQIAATVHRAAPARAVTWVIAEGVRAQGDLRLLTIVLENLLGNAFKFTSKRPESRIEFGVQEDAGSQKVYFVRDDGAGFDMKRADRLFSVFKRLHRETDFPGTGIGLATVKRIVTRHGGRIWAEGAVGQGATLYFTLPAARRAEELREAATPMEGAAR